MWLEEEEVKRVVPSADLRGGLGWLGEEGWGDEPLDALEEGLAAAEDVIFGLGRGLNWA